MLQVSRRVCLRRVLIAGRPVTLRSPRSRGVPKFYLLGTTNLVSGSGENNGSASNLLVNPGSYPGLENQRNQPVRVLSPVCSSLFSYFEGCFAGGPSSPLQNENSGGD